MTRPSSIRAAIAHSTLLLTVDADFRAIARAGVGLSLAQ